MSTKLSAKILSTLVGFGLFIWIASSVSTLITNYKKNERETQFYQEIKERIQTSNEFEANGFSAKRMKDDRILLTFYQNHPEKEDIQWIKEIILSPKDFEYVSAFLRLKNDALNSWRDYSKARPHEAMKDYRIKIHSKNYDIEAIARFKDYKGIEAWEIKSGGRYIPLNSEILAPLFKNDYKFYWKKIL